MKVAIILSTYNWPEALNACLRSIGKQSIQPDQVLIGDDGSGPSTKEVIDYWKQSLPIIHHWQEDTNFRLARTRNNCLRFVEAEYVLCIDSDMVLHKDFVKDHLKFAKPNTYVQGSRVLLNKAYSEIVMSPGNEWEWDTADIKKGTLGNNKNLIRSRLLSWLSGLSQKATFKHTRTCNMAFWMDDLTAVNGFDNRYEGWGREDSDLTARLVKYGLKKRTLKFAATALHLYHKEVSRQSLEENDLLLKHAIESEDYYSPDGIIEADKSHPAHP